LNLRERGGFLAGLRVADATFLGCTVSSFSNWMPSVDVLRSAVVDPKVAVAAAVAERARERTPTPSHNFATAQAR
jgi:hypothetical protein